MSLSLPVAKEAKQSSEKQISDLADADLSAIFERLPPYDRLIISEVCRRWHELSRKPWFDITELDLSSIPSKHVGAVVRQCPNLLSVVARKMSFNLNELCSLAQASKLAAIKFYGCSFAVKRVQNVFFEPPHDVFAKVFSENLQRASSVRELILHDGHIEYGTVLPSSLSTTDWTSAASCLSASLTQLQLSELRVERSIFAYVEPILEDLGRFQSLECLMLRVAASSAPFFFSWWLKGIDVPRVCALKNLRELSISSAWPLTEAKFGRLVANLPKLQVLHLNNTTISDGFGDRMKADLVELITKNSVLRILIFSGYFYLSSGIPALELPARKRFPHGFDSDPLPVLHIFIGKAASEQIHFATSPSEAAIIHPINQPMPQFLEREDIAPIFAGVWIAERIKESAKFGHELWFHERDDKATVVQRT